MTTLIISNEEMDNITKIKSLNGAGVLIRGISETLENEAKEKKVGSLGMLVGTLGAYLWGILEATYR